jgi:hypothetical protein
MTEQPATPPQSHVLRVDTVDFVGAFRRVDLHPGMNIVRGDITTGKTTFVRLIRALLGAIPKYLPPETASIRSIAADLVLGDRVWQVLRPMVTTKDVPVEVAEDGDPRRENTPQGIGDGIALRLPAAGTGGFGEFLLQQLGVPVVFVPKARTDPTSDLSPVTINDWLNYCIVTGDELDAQVFGHRDVFRNHKRRWVFEILYNLYDKELAALNAKARVIDREIAATEAEREVIGKFLVDAQVGDRFSLEVSLEGERLDLEALGMRKASLARASNQEPAGHIAGLRTEVLELRRSLDHANAEFRSLEAQIRDLSDLERELTNLSKRLTRSIVADEWMVDFDFVVCPRCGQDVDQDRTEHPVCYLCEQPEPTTTPSRDVLIKEQDRVTFQITETEQLLARRRAAREELLARARELSDALQRVSARLDDATAEFVSTHASELQAIAAEVAAATANIEWIQRLLTLFAKHEDQEARLAALRDRLLELQEEIEQHQSSITAGEENIIALENRMLQYLERLNVPTLGDLLTVKINRETYLPEVSTRNFDELSSQGLKTLVNVTHALAHHTVAIDRNLFLPGLLVLDGVSANSGKEGLDGDRVLDMYRLFTEVSETYREQLQLVIVDNEVPEEVLRDFGDRVVLTLSQSDRLIRTSWPDTANDTIPNPEVLG